jgi:hypothetical protein
MLIKFMAQESMIFTDTIQYYKFLRKKSDTLVWTFLLQCPSIWHFRRMFFEFRFYPIWNRWCANTEICCDISQDLAIFNSSHSLQFLFNCYYNMFSSSRHCLQSLLNEILKLHCKKRTHINLPLVRTRQLITTNWWGEAQRCLVAGSSGNRSAWQAFRLTRVSVKRRLDNRGSTVHVLCSCIIYM